MGKARVKLLERDAIGTFVDTDDTDGDGMPANLVDKYGADDNVTITTSGRTITANIKELNGTEGTAVNVTIQYGIGTGDYQGQVQYTAAADVEIIGRFKSGASGRNYPAAAPVTIRIGNVEEGSGTARITSPSSHSVKAGSKDNAIRIQYTAAGTMDRR